MWWSGSFINCEEQVVNYNHYTQKKLTDAKIRLSVIIFTVMKSVHNHLKCKEIHFRQSVLLSNYYNKALFFPQKKVEELNLIGALFERSGIF